MTTHGNGDTPVAHPTLSAKSATIRQFTYEPYRGRLLPRSARLWAMTRVGLRQASRFRWARLLMVAALLQAAIGAVVMYGALMTNGVLMQGDYVIYKILTQPYGTLLVTFGVLLFGGSSAISDDTRTGAFHFYFARPIDRDFYLLGKALPLSIAGVVAALSSPLLLCIARLAMAPSASDVLAAMRFPLYAIVVALFEVPPLVAMALCISSFSRSRGYAQGAFAAAFLLPWMVGKIFVGVTLSPWPAMLSLPALVDSVARFLFAVTPAAGDHVVPVWAAVPMLVGGTLVLLYWLRSRLQRVEVLG